MAELNTARQRLTARRLLALHAHYGPNATCTNAKAVVSGTVVEIYRYQRGVVSGYAREASSGRAGASGDGAKSEEARAKNREEVLRRARRDIRRTVEANIGQYFDAAGDPYTAKFATFTFRENVSDLKEANAEWRRFVKRLGYSLTGRESGIKYLVVVEFQKRGAVHYHAVFFNLPYVPAKELADIWGQGFVRVNALTAKGRRDGKDVERVGSYVCKYLSKDAVDGRLEGQKSHFQSRGLFKPIEIADEDQVNDFEARLPRQWEVCRFQFDTEYQGQVSYVQYRMADRNTRPKS